MCLAASACVTAQPVVRLTPRSADVKWVQGRGVVVQEHEGVRVAVAYDRNLDERIAFRLEVVNQSPNAVLVDPRHLVCSYCSLYPHGAIGFEQACPQRIAFVDPESQALAVEVAQAHAEASHQNQQAWNTGMLFLGVVTDVAHASKGRSSNSSALVAATMSANESQHEQSQIHYGSELQFWQEATLRRTTLGTGESTAGLVLVQQRPNVPLVILSVVVGGKHFRFDFDQMTVNAEEAPGTVGYARRHGL